jgi:hypothetical protein
LEDIYHVWGVGNACDTWLENLRERDHLGDLTVDGRSILKWIIEK